MKSGEYKIVVVDKTKLGNKTIDTMTKSGAIASRDQNLQSNSRLLQHISC